MTIEEVSKKYNIAISSLKNNFPRCQESIFKKYGVKIKKEGRGIKAEFREEYESDNRAVSIFQEEKEDMILDISNIKLINWDFLVFLALVMTPMLVFRGSYEDFLKYIEVKVTKANVELLKESLNSLFENDMISYIIDKTDSNYFVAAVYRKIEEKMQVSIDMVRNCKLLAKKHNKRSWVPLLKIWLGVNILSNHQPYTMKDLCELTGLSEYQVKVNNKILKEADIYKTDRVYLSKDVCSGVNVDLNMECFYDI